MMYRPSASRTILSVFLLAAASALGTVYFIGLFLPVIRGALGLSEGTVSTIFAATTLLGAPLIALAGPLSDTTRPGLYIPLLFTALGIGCLALGLTHSVVSFGLAAFILRSVGDWLFNHAALMLVVRVHPSKRAPATLAMSAGHALGAAVFPFLAVAIAERYGWRNTWLVIACGSAGLALLLGVIWNTAPRNADIEQPIRQSHEMRPSLRRSFRLLLSDRLFRAALPSALCMPLILSGLFFHQATLALERGWGLSDLAGFFGVYAMGQAAGPYLGVYLARKVGVANSVWCSLIPIIVALLFLLLLRDGFAFAPYLLFSGLTVGMTSITLALFWGEAFGLHQVGTVRSLVQGIVLLASSSSVLGFGIAIEFGISYDQILVCCLLAAVACMSSAIRLPSLMGPRSTAG